MTKMSLAVLGAFSLLLGCREAYLVEPIASQAVLSKDWEEFRPAYPLRWSRPEEELSFHVDTPHQIGEQLQIIGPAGERFVPEVELLGDNGKSFVMDSHGFLGEEMVFTFRNKPSDFTSIQAIRIRSSIPIKVSDIVWRGFDPKEVKR